LAATQLLKEFRVLVFYEPHNEPVLEKVRQRMRIDVALPMPASDEAIKATLKAWL